ncbi:MAG TPA: hypothetical protein VN715_21055, partial [Roseiarcus sp.]|nr:hypothetical protein [Roseiarcus sp.]
MNSSAGLAIVSIPEIVVRRQASASIRRRARTDTPPPVLSPVSASLEPASAAVDLGRWLADMAAIAAAGAADPQAGLRSPASGVTA